MPAKKSPGMLNTPVRTLSTPAPQNPASPPAETPQSKTPEPTDPTSPSTGKLCAACKVVLTKENSSAAQFKKPTGGKCKTCVGAASTDASTSPGRLAPAKSTKSPPTKPRK
eukprot:TRINITY_DN5422_c0_g1_i5.p1 TRINITY_DN5422_c0_g1~~TRINITY_DN5422_c0_g1_i5.p1  ORF type:complete len:111 (-),score=29.90 TRINITY_DN5422_c0_g1_i5:44-376(-)